MSIQRALSQRSNDMCELCSNPHNLSEHVVSPKSGDSVDHIIAICETCKVNLDETGNLEANHWRCLNESMWSEVPAVQVVAYRMLHKLQTTDWAPDLIDMMYLDDSTREWAELGIVDPSDIVVHKDSNGVILEPGDTVTLIKDLKVKGASLVAKRGTAVRKIRLVRDNSNHIEGRVDGQTVVILTQYVKK